MGRRALGCRPQLKFKWQLQMDVWGKKIDRMQPVTGVLFKQPMAKDGRAFARVSKGFEMLSGSKHPLAFAGIYLLMVLWFVRPQEVMPWLVGSLPIIKIVALSTALIYVISKTGRGERVITWQIELKMMMVIGVMGALLIPLAASSRDSLNVLLDPMISNLLFSILLIELIDTRARLRLMLRTLVFCSLLYAISAMKSFMAGGYNPSFDKRIQGWGTLLE